MKEIGPHDANYVVFVCDHSNCPTSLLRTEFPKETGIALAQIHEVSGHETLVIHFDEKNPVPQDAAQLVRDFIQK